MKFLGINISVDIKDRRAQLIIAIGVSIGIAVFLGAAGFALMLSGLDKKESKDGSNPPEMEEPADKYLDGADMIDESEPEELEPDE